jgi:prolyl-tRNA synthetase
MAYSLKKRLNLRIHVDDRDQLKPGRKYYEWEKKGIPLRVEIGPRDLAAQKVMIVDRLSGTKESLSIEEFCENAHKILDRFQMDLFSRALEFRKQNTFKLDDYNEFKQNVEKTGGFFLMPWCESSECEVKIKEETKATIRCLSLEESREDGKCVYCGKPSQKRVIFAKSY